MRKILISVLAAIALIATAHAQAVNSTFVPLRSKLVVATRDLTVATGTQAITGFGFTPTVCFAASAVATVILNSANSQFFQFFGMSDPSRVVTSTAVGAGSFITTATNFIELVDQPGTGSQLATVSSYDVDGLTLSWTKAGTPSGTAQIYILCQR